MNVVMGLPLNVATIILSCIFSVLFSDFRARVPISVPTPHIVTLTECFHADAKTNVHPLHLSWYFISLLWVYLCSCTHSISMFWSIAEAVSSTTWPNLFKVLTLNVAICIVRLHFSNFCLIWALLAIFGTLGPGLHPEQDTPFLYPRKYRCSLDKRFEYESWWFFRWLCFYSLL